MNVESGQETGEHATEAREGLALRLIVLQHEVHVSLSSTQIIDFGA